MTEKEKFEKCSLKALHIHHALKQQFYQPFSLVTLKECYHALCELVQQEVLDVT